MSTTTVKLRGEPRVSTFGSFDGPMVCIETPASVSLSTGGVDGHSIKAHVDSGRLVMVLTPAELDALIDSLAEQRDALRRVAA